MTDTHTTSQADLDAQTYQAYLDNGENKAAAARALGVNASTVADRIKRHQARHDQDTLADSRALDAAQAEQDAEYAADSEAERGEDPDESVTALLDDGEPGQPAVLPDPVHHGGVFARVEASSGLSPAEADAFARIAGEPRQAPVTEVAEAEGYEGPTCPTCNAVAYAFKGGHFTGCEYHKDPAQRGTRQAEPATAESQPAQTAEPAQDEPAKPAQAEKAYVAECERCGWHFSRPQARTTCQSERACQRRQDEKASAGTAA